MTMLNRILVLLAVIGGLAAMPAQAQLQITVSGGDVAALPIAIVPFAQTTDMKTDIAQVVENDLVRSGRFRALPRAQMSQRPSDPGNFDPTSWRAQGMDNVVIGKVWDDGKGGYIARFYLLDSLSGKQIIAYDYPIKDLSQSRYAAHWIADKIYEQLLGVPGYFNTKIAYVSAHGLGFQRTYQLVITDSDGENPQYPINSRETLMSPTWSPDRKQIALVGYEHGRSAIYLYSTETGKVTKLVSEKGINGSPAWSPDGKKLAFVLSFETNPDIYVMDMATRKRTRLTDHYGIDTEPAWSPDGSKIIFTSDRGGKPQVYEMGADGGNVRRLTFQGSQNQRPSYSPDGKSILYVTTGQGGQRIALQDLATGQVHMLSDGPLDEGPCFAPGGAVIIYSSQGPHGRQLETVSVDGRVRMTMRQASGDVQEPSWSPVLR
ncbi:Tol-Pal system beta propeller repeat protein TolB [Solimonas marina]|uniref:Tol-Pal system protein TolB n=1 Tax=Solimonas marina TaxID=2714601 RepID=A0A969WDG7_9GAMM|nr:Tol-Pal system beta propeller repeat protein TolB [Solimonas marina]NKF24184.1 Tol-Pal system beta propeller repeat protein TolB [Solimonas marina]